MGKEVFAKIPFTYNGKPLDRGQLLELEGCKNDVKLVGQNFLIPFDAVHDRRWPCDMCGQKFATEMHLHMHRAKPTCIAEGPEVTRQEQAELLDVDPSKMVLDPIEDSAGYRPPSTDAGLTDL